MPPPIVHLGPPASGKSHSLFNSFRAALQNQNDSVRLLVPTATLAEHLRHKFCREGFLLRKHSILTLHDFTQTLNPALGSPTPAQFSNIIAQALHQHCPPEYEPIQAASGFREVLAATLSALNLACADEVPAPLDRLYTSIQNLLATQNLALRGTRLSHLSQHLTPPSGITHLLLDGFFGFANAELLLLKALTQHLQLELTLPSGPEADRAIAALSPQIQTYSSPQRQANLTLLAAGTREGEVLEVARRILALQAVGTPLRHCAVALANPAAYAPLIESTFTRLGIPSRSYLSQPLSRHPLIQLFRDCVAAAQSGWEHSQVLNALRWQQTGLGGTPIGDQLEIETRRALPQSGPDAFPQLIPFAQWDQAQLTPAEWAQELSQLPNLLLLPNNLPATLETAHHSQQRTQVLETYHRCLQDAATALTPPNCGADSQSAGSRLVSTSIALPLSHFWPHVEAGLRSTSLFERDSRREVVHILDLHEARQWEAPHIFAPGLLEGEFPRRSTPDPLLTDEYRRRQGMKTQADQDHEQQQLFAVLSTRSTQSTTFLYPRSNAKGDPTLPSLFLTQKAQPAPTIEIQTPAPAFQLQSGQLSRGYRRSRPWSASEFELYLQCPFKHFAQRGLALQGLPDLPGERLNAALLGQIAHEVIAEWTPDPTSNIETLTERALQKACRKHRIPPGYHYELSRLNLLRHMRLFAAHAPNVPPGWQTHLEEDFQFTHQSGIQIRGVIDRYDLSPSGQAHAYDFKYSKVSGLSEKYVQGGLYTQALSKNPQVTSVEQFAYVALREDAKLEVMDGERLTNILKIFQQDIEAVVQGVSEGRIPVQPKDPKLCQYCDFSDACRIATRQVEEEETYTPPESEDALTASS